ncbi:lycopene cyclase domain-containing protein [Candidatus Leptofilum sp.]|uniref:lycopene cyclase domain-containing protein n=1 Tax=Candidatus Leptofilum sp. TaxID=3241576 RepID=UPI003B5C4506
MTYFGFLGLFLVIPIIIMLGLTWRDARQGRQLPQRFASYSPWAILLLHLLMALAYTTPWDNYLVATSVWWYDRAKVTGIVLGYVPIEEYTFFILQPILTGLWLLFWLRRQPNHVETGWENGRFRRTSLIILGILWLSMVYILMAGWAPGTYLALILAWALLPIMLQIGYGGDILWRHRRVVLLGLLPVTLFLAAVDALAIYDGIWTIDPAQTINWYLGGILPFEEFLFFLITNVLIVFGMTLFLATESQKRLDQIKAMIAQWRARKLQVAREK